MSEFAAAASSSSSTTTLTSSTHYEVIVVGLGGHGSAALAQLAKANVSVLGIEQFHLTHSQGR